MLPPWDDETMAEPGTDRGWPWRANLRWLQSWWREDHLGVEPGPGPSRQGKSRSAWLPLAAADPPQQRLNFFDEDVTEIVADRVERGSEWGGIVKPDRVYRSLLSSQPVCFNLFGYLARNERLLLSWLQSMGLDAVSIERTEDSDPLPVRIEYAPPRKAHLHSGSAFDACVTYRDSARRRGFVAIETKYAENLGDQSSTADPKYAQATAALGHWKDSAVAVLNVPLAVQCWQNLLLAQKAVEQRTHGWELGTFVMVADGHDLGALKATAMLRSQLHDGEPWVRWSPYQAIVDLARADTDARVWADWFTTRYLDLSPVQHRLRPDPNRAAEVLEGVGATWAIDGFVSSASRAITYGSRALGQDSLLAGLSDADLRAVDTLDLVAAAIHLETLPEPIAEGRRLAKPIHDAVEGLSRGDNRQ
jgi:hypothetical protein